MTKQAESPCRDCERLRAVNAELLAGLKTIEHAAYAVVHRDRWEEVTLGNVGDLARTLIDKHRRT